MAVLGRSYHLIKKARNAALTFSRMVVGYQFLVVILFGFLVPLSPLLVVLYAMKKIEQACFSWLYNAIPIIPKKANRQNRIILIVVNGRIALDKLREHFVQNVIDSHNVNGDLSFPNVARALTSSWLNTYWIDEKRFRISNHIQLLSDESCTFQDIPTLLNKIQRTRFEDTKGNTLSPWLIKIHYMENDQSAIFFKIDPLLDDSAIIQALFSDTKYKKTSNDNINPSCEQDSSYFTNLCKHIGLTGWIMLQAVVTFTKNKLNFKHQKTEKNSKQLKKTYLCSKSIDTSSFQQLGFHLGVSARYVILSCITMAIDAKSFPNGYIDLSSSSYNFGDDGESVSKIRFKITSSINKPNRKTLDIARLKKCVETLKAVVSFDPAFCDVIFKRVLSTFNDLFVPAKLSKYFVLNTSTFTKKDDFHQIKVDMNSLDIMKSYVQHQQQQNEMFLNHEIQSFSVWNKQALGLSNAADADNGFKITVTENMKSLVLCTVSDQNKEHLALDFLKRFHSIQNEISRMALTS